METRCGPGRTFERCGPELRLLGPLTLLRDGAEIALPSSRKARALLAYLALAKAPISRSQLCEMLWDVPNDPRGELRWCLSKIRGLIDDPDRQRLHAKRDSVWLDLSDCVVDVAQVQRATGESACQLGLDQLRAVVGQFRGELLDGLEIDRCPIFMAWLVAERRRYRSCYAVLLELHSRQAPEAEAQAALERLVAISPYDLQAHTRLLAALAQRGRIREGEQHVGAAAKLFEADGLDAAPLREAWKSARAGSGARSTSAVARADLQPSAADEGGGVQSQAPRRASIAVMPFTGDDAANEAATGLAGALVHDLITCLAKLRSLFVIAQGTVFALHERRIRSEDSGRLLGVDYIVSGHLLRRGDRIVVPVELAETRTARIIWANTFHAPVRDALAVLDRVGTRIVSSVVAEIEMHERNRAILKAPSSLDAWEAYHRGLWHMYRFTRPDNEQARHFFAQATQQDPTFSRAFAGLSFTYWQDAFQGWAADRQKMLDIAYGKASDSLLADDRDPAAHWAMGRALWLRGRHDESVNELEQAVDLSPNFALAHYNLAFVHATTGDAAAALTYSDASRELSPYDPMLFGMLGARAMGLVRLGRYDEAANWAVKAAARPNAFPHIRCIAAFSLALADRMDEARTQLAVLVQAVPGYSFADFQRAFRFDATSVNLFRKGAQKLGLA